MAKNLTRFISAVIISITIIFIGMIFFLVYGIPYSITSEIKSKRFNGVIANIHQAQSCFSTIEVNQQGRTTKFDVCYCVPNKDFFKYASVGDSIKKEQGQLLLIITKANSGMKKRFDYPYCIQ